MKQFPLVQLGNPNFRSACTEYTVKEMTDPDTKTLIQRMIYTMRSVHGVGLAAPQIGLQRQLFVMRISPSRYRPTAVNVAPYAVFNPHILSRRGMAHDWEGCFSVAKAGLFAIVPRPESIRVRYRNEKAESVEKELTGLEARIFQHEYDHLHGTVFLDLHPDPGSFMDVAEYRKMLKTQHAH